MLNTVTLMGRLVTDPQLKKTQNDISVATFAVAVDRGYIDKDEQRQADFIDVVAWRSTADFIEKYFFKGSMIAIVGALQTRSYIDKDGRKRKVVEVVASKVSFCGNKSQGSERADFEKKENAAADDFDYTTLSPDDDLPF